ncbi:FtsX-like permease family protein [Rugamonas sp. FT82W]|uniref:FtsX-like permease family protein n=1 Tax=Duganella vulcania TaxID=2692166 RepID=A0A845G8L9_9BURK|nr:ABC transporter permease [Duganella vulcania]MYM89765.1 FtsX-like permease family protein [Duganella vulcania]
MKRALLQIMTIAMVNLRNLPQRTGTSLVLVIGNAGVVAVLVSVLAMAAGFTHTMHNTGRADRVIVMRGGANSETTSALQRAAVQKILDAPGIRKDAGGRPLASAESVTVVNVLQNQTGNRSNVTLRGLGPQAAALRPEIRLVQGRMFEPGKGEIIVGRAAQQQFQGLGLGQHINLAGTSWTVVGLFESAGDSHESELMTDVATVFNAYRRTFFQSVTLWLNSADDYDKLKAALGSDPGLNVAVVRESDYYAELSRGLTRVMTLVGLVVGGIMAIGAVFGALNTMYSAISTRRVEIATLRAMGFGSLSVLVSVVLEALLLAVAGGAVGAALAWGVFNGNVVNTLGSNFTQVVFRLMVTPELIGLGIAFAACIGLIGGLLPGVRAIRMPVASALRAL